MWIEYKDMLINLNLTQAIYLEEDFIRFYSPGETDPIYIEFESEEEAKEFLFNEIYPKIEELNS